MMNEETKKWWTKFYMIFGNNGCSGWSELDNLGFCEPQGTYPFNVLSALNMYNLGYIEDYKSSWKLIKFTDKFIKEISNDTL